MKKNKTALIAIVIGIIIIILLSFAIIKMKGKSPVSRTEFSLDTICTITLYEWDGNEDELLDDAFEICSDYEKILSSTVSTSDIYRINHSNGKPVTVAPDTATVILNAIEYSKLSRGLFDITILPVKNLWDFGGDNSNIPHSDDLEKAVRFVDYTKISVEGCEITLPKGMGIDLGGIAKGFITDRVADYLKQQKVTSAIIDFGGNVYVIGNKTDGTNWKIGIQKPFGESAQQIKTIEAHDTSVVTSGVYQRYFKREGKLYHHILNAKTGMPCNTGLFSVTIIDESSEKCDALSTVCMLLGYEKSMKILSQYPDIQAVFVTSDYQVLTYK